MSPFVAEIVGTALLITLGGGVVANVVLKKTKGENAGLIVIAWGWALAVFVGVFVTARFDEGHLNPAVTLGLATAGKFPWEQVPLYFAAQMIGAMIGASIVRVFYHAHFAATEDFDAKMAVFCTSPAIRSAPLNLFSEVVATFVLIFGVLYLAAPDVAGSKGEVGGLGAIDAFPVALLVLGIGLSLGGTTGYAINPARDLGPRLIHALLPMPGGKRDSDWSYAWIPVVGPLLGAVIAAAAYVALGGDELPLPAVK